MGNNLKLKIFINTNKMNRSSSLFLNDRHDSYFSLVINHFKSTFLTNAVSYDVAENGYVITIQNMSDEISAVQAVTDYFMGILPSANDCVSWTESVSMPEADSDKAILISNVVSSHENIKNLNVVFGNTRNLTNLDMTCLASLARTSGHFINKDITSGKINMSNSRKPSSTMSSECIILDNEDYYCRVLNYPSHEPTDSSNILLVYPKFDLYIEDKSDKGRRSAIPGKYGGYVYKINLNKLMSPTGIEVATMFYRKEVYIPTTKSSGNFPFELVNTDGDYYVKDAAIQELIRQDRKQARDNVRSNLSNIIKRR